MRLVARRIPCVQGDCGSLSSVYPSQAVFPVRWIVASLLTCVAPSLAQNSGSSRAVTGIVLDANSSRVAGASIEITGSGIDLKAVSAYDGTFGLNAPGGRYTVTVDSFGFCRREFQHFFVRPNNATTLKVVLRVCPIVDRVSSTDHIPDTPRTLRGTVTDPTGALIPDSEVQAEGDAISVSTTTTRYGTFSLEIPAGVYTVSATRVGFSPAKHERVEVRSRTATVLEFTLHVRAERQR